MTIETRTMSGTPTRNVVGIELRATWHEKGNTRALATLFPIGCDDQQAAELLAAFARRLQMAVSK